MIHPATRLQFINDVIGFGVVATELIPRGTIVWVRDRLDRTLTAADVRGLGPLFQAQLEKYTYTDGAGDRVLCWDIARYVNHSCDPSCLAPGFDLELAVRDIAPGEQLTDDYAALNLAGQFPCACGAPGCRGLVRPDDHLRLAAGWDAAVRAAFPQVGRVAQPLWPLVPQADEVATAAEGRAPVPSGLVHIAGARR